MPHPRKDKGHKTRTFHLNGETYQERMIQCGTPTCTTCSDFNGHLSFYRYQPAQGDDKGYWEYTGSRPPRLDDQYRPAHCAAPNCKNPITEHGRSKYCSARCRVAANRARKKDPQ